MNNKQQAMLMYVEDIPVEDIAEELDVSIPTIYRWLEIKANSIKQDKYKQAVHLYQNTSTPVNTICTNLKISPPTLYNQLDIHNIPRRNSTHQPTEDTEQDIVELYLSGAMIHDVQAMHDIHPTQMYAILRKYNVPLRTKPPH